MPTTIQPSFRVDVEIGPYLAYLCFQSTPKFSRIPPKGELTENNGFPGSLFRVMLNNLMFLVIDNLLVGTLGNFGLSELGKLDFHVFRNLI